MSLRLYRTIDDWYFMGSDIFRPIPNYDETTLQKKGTIAFVQPYRSYSSKFAMRIASHQLLVLLSPGWISTVDLFSLMFTNLLYLPWHRVRFALKVWQKIELNCTGLPSFSVPHAQPFQSHCVCLCVYVPEFSKKLQQ